MNDNQQTEITNETIEETLETDTQANAESIPSMDDFEDQLDKSFQRVNVGDILKGTIVGISDTEVIIDLSSYAEGIIRANDFSSDSDFSLEDDVAIGDEVSAKVINMDDGEGNILLSKKQADLDIAWSNMQDNLENETVISVKITNSVKGGVITPLEGIRGFIPASQLSVSYVENLEDWVGKEVEAIVITVDESKNRLVLSSKKVELTQIKEERKEAFADVEKGQVLKGTIDNIVPYGAFVKLDNGLSGLVHISQLSNKFVKTPNEVVKEGQEVDVKVIDIKDGKINLSMKALEEAPKRDFSASRKPTNRPQSKPRKQKSEPVEFTSDQEATTSLGDLLKDLDL